MANVHEEAKRRILKAFPPSSDPVSEFGKYPEEFYLETLAIMFHRIPFRKASENESVSRFLYAGCLRFDRWFAPSPFVVDIRQREHYAQFVRALRTVGSTDNTAVFCLHEIRDALYAEFDGSPTENVAAARIEYYRSRIREVAAPSALQKASEYDRELSIVQSILTGLEDGSLRTVLVTRLPYILNRSPLSLSFRWHGVAGVMQIEPSFSQSGESAVIGVPAISSVGASRWQSGRSRVVISLAALYDGDAYTAPLQTLHEHDLPIEGWPKCFTVAFKIVHEVAWHLRIAGGSEAPWIPAPRDLGDVEMFVRTKRTERLTEKLKSSPANLMIVFSPTKEVTTRDLGELETHPWSVKCRSLAVIYMELGEMNEALFWLNVATEALFKERFSGIALECGRPELEAELNSPKAFWALAEEVVSEQYPEMAGRISWPDAELHVSVFAKLKYLYRAVSMKTSVNTVITRYRNISQHRNALFHGMDEKRPSVAVMRLALESFDWLAANVVRTLPESALPSATPHEA